MICKVRPYEGEKPYIFFSYCHQNAELVYPIIEKMAMEGFRIWYDNGIHPGDNWIETIASHINNAYICIAAVTPQSVESHNCRNEINFAIEHNKRFIPLILEKFRMSLGVRMQLSSSHFIKKYEMADETQFYGKLYEVEGIQECCGEKTVLSEDEEKNYEQEIEKFEKEKQQRKQEEQQKKVVLIEEPQIVEEEKENSVQEEEEFYDDEFEPTEVEERTVRITRNKRQKREHEEESGRKAVFIRFTTKEVFPLKKASTQIGRSKGQCDIVISDPTISSVHAVIVRNSQDFYLRDADSENGTLMNMVMLEGLQPVLLDRCVLVTLAEEMCMFAADDLAKSIMETKKCVLLECEETDEIKPLAMTDLRLGRANAWAGGTFSNRRASRNHGTIRYENGIYVLEASNKETTNGTFLNEQRLSPSQKIELKNDDVIRIGSVYHIKFREIDLKLGGETN